MGMSRKTGPRCGDAAVVNASDTAAPISAVRWIVAACLVTGASSGGWSSSCSAPEPQRLSGDRPPITTSGLPLKCAVVMPLTTLVTPGPAVTTARPGVRVSLAVASAANTAVCSCRTSIRRRGALPWPSAPALPPTAASYIGNTCAPESVNIVSTPCATAACTACAPPWALRVGRSSA